MMDLFDVSLLLAAADTGPLKGFRYPLLAGLIALAVSWVLTPLVRRLAIEKGAVDDPKRDERRIHKEPLPRWGGLAIYGGIVVSLLVVLPFAYRDAATKFPLWLIGVIVVGAVLVLAGALDDLFQYSAKVQLLLLLGAGFGIQFFADSIGKVQIGSLGIPLTTPPAHIKLYGFAFVITALYIFVVTKTMDTIDGVDGLAAGIATISAATLVILAVYGGQPRVAIVSASIAGGALGFLRHNYNPAKIIMGTGGAYILGFTLASVSIVGAFKTAAAVALLIPVLAFGVPIFDAFFVITRRLLARVPITQADKRHVHHTLLGRGLTQRQTVGVLYIAAAVLCAVLLLLVRSYA